MLKDATGSFKAIESGHDASVEQFLSNAFCELPHLESLFLFAPTGEVVFASQSVAGELKRGKLKYLALQTPSGFIVATRLKPGHILILLGRIDVRLGLVLYEMESLASRLELALAA